jgi:N-acyl-L-homoserine lactone synthetase
MTPQTRLDLLADDLLAGVAPLELDVATTAVEADAVLRLRYACAIELGWAQPHEHPDGREHDAWDEGATFVVCRSDGELVGATRLVPPVPGRPLLLEEELGVEVTSADRVLEAGRVVVPRRQRRRSHRILTGLFARGWLAARELGFDRIVGQATPELVALYSGLGLEVTPLGPSRTYFGEERIPIEVAGPGT